MCGANYDTPAQEKRQNADRRAEDNADVASKLQYDTYLG